MGDKLRKIRPELGDFLRGLRGALSPSGWAAEHRALGAPAFRLGLGIAAGVLVVAVFAGAVRAFPLLFLLPA